MSRLLQSRWTASILVLTILAYSAVRHAGFVWDDDDHITQNPVLRDANGLLRIWFEPTSLPQYYPLVHTTFWLEFRLWGVHPTGYHLTNVLLHAANASLFLGVLHRLRVPGAWFAAMLFALHPVHVESVAWVTERKNVLSAFFYLLALRAWLRWVDTADAGTAGDTAKPAHGPAHAPARARRLWWAALLLFASALLSKTVTCSLPAVFLLVEYWRRGRVPARILHASLPFFALGLLLAAVTVVLEHAHVRAAGAEFDLSPAERLLVAGRALWFYLGSLIWPAGLSFNYERWSPDPASALQWTFPLAALALVALLFALRHRSRAPLVAALCFGGSLVPALGFVNVYPMRYSFVADHFQYLADLAPLALFAGAAAHLQRRYWPHRTALAATLAALLLALLAFATHRQARIYENHETLWTHTIGRNPRSWLARCSLAQIQIARGELAAAREHLTAALAVREAPEPRLLLGLACFEAGDLESAREHLERAVALAPGDNAALVHLAEVLHAAGDSDEARARLERALAIRADYDRARAVLGLVLHEQGRSRAALPHLERAIALNPMAIDAMRTLARARLAVGEPEGAIEMACSALDRSVRGERLHHEAVDRRAWQAFLAREREAAGEALLDVLAQALPRLGRERAAGVAAQVFAALPAAGPLAGPLVARLRETDSALASAVAAAVALEGR